MLTRELGPINRLSTCAVMVREVASLQHELEPKHRRVIINNSTAAKVEHTHVRNNSVERAPCIPKSMLASRKLAEVARRLGDCLVE